MSYAQTLDASSAVLFPSTRHFSVTTSDLTHRRSVIDIENVSINNSDGSFQKTTRAFHLCTPQIELKLKISS